MFSPSLETKKKFIAWFIKHHPIPKREALWILNYLLNHELMLKQVHFVQQAEKTPRGMTISTLKQPNDCFVFYKNGLKSTVPEQAFHDLRLNWKESCYIELEFPQAYETMIAFEVMEANPYYEYDREQVLAVETGLERMKKIALKDELLQQIHYALETGDQDLFFHLTNQLHDLEEELK